MFKERFNKNIFFTNHNKIYKMEYTGIWSNVITINTYCTKCRTKIDTYYPNRCISCNDIFCSKCLKRCEICKNNYCKKCQKLYKFKKTVCATCHQSKNKCIIS